MTQTPPDRASMTVALALSKIRDTRSRRDEKFKPTKANDQEKLFLLGNPFTDGAIHRRHREPAMEMLTRTWARYEPRGAQG